MDLEIFTMTLNYYCKRDKDLHHQRTENKIPVKASPEKDAAKNREQNKNLHGKIGGLFMENCAESTG